MRALASPVPTHTTLGLDGATATAPMAEVGAAYLPWGAAWFVTLGAVMAVATSLNVTMLAPSRVGS